MILYFLLKNIYVNVAAASFIASFLIYPNPHIKTDSDSRAKPIATFMSKPNEKIPMNPKTEADEDKSPNDIRSAWGISLCMRRHRKQ